ncbi:YbaN family protein [Paraclostridium tenue]|uniref:YbaN family protein n=1 Tax=Paeniclostridium hominis TaxID=2764329 RepID=A0ABR7K2X2_9FIRM|nr:MULTISPECIES: YbaN family protein [Paeniclostridium]MBC6003448.1 YbaN family protein [Paeniclostridium hominis]MDU1539696.1 YbaN family protein [Paeniclostridium sordellii]
MNKIKKYIYVTVGLLSFAIGAIGVILPILPTTPFLLLASFCFVRGSEKFDRWFKSTKMYKKHLESFVNEKAMTMKQKVIILLFVNIMLAIPIILVDNLHMRLFLLGLICIKLYYFIFKIKTIKPCSVNE